MELKYDFSVNDVSAVYAGPGGKLWELLMGEQIHVGGAEQTEVLAQKIDLDQAGPATTVLDICSALGGPARYLAKVYSVHVVGLDITPEMVEEAKLRTADQPYEDLIEYRLGSALDIPAHRDSFDVVWGQDAWCYVRDKRRLMEEIHRVLKPGGTLAFTDWIWGPAPPSKTDADFLMEFMVFPDLQTLDGYSALIEETGLRPTEVEDLGEDFANHMDTYIEILQEHRDEIVANFGADLYEGAEKGVIAWQQAAHQGNVSRGL